MNSKVVIFYLGKILQIVSAFLALPIFVGLFYGEFVHVLPFFITVAIFLALGFAMSHPFRGTDRKLGNKEGLAIVGLSWVTISLIGALPFIFDGCIPNYVDALFETVSGFTTTGATILTDIEPLPRCMLFWRSFTHWLGGMGILVFILAILPGTDGSTYHLFKFESPGPQVGKLASKVRHTATILYLIYLAMTLLQFFLLLCGGIGFFHSAIIAMGTAGTGGFAATGLSIGEFDNLYVEIVVTVFMFLFSLNFNLYYLIILRHVKVALMDEEFHFYCGYVVAATLAIAVNLISTYGNFAEALRYASFTVVSLTSSTGFSTTDFSQWPQFSQAILMLCMAFGACAGSTGGGLKASRVLVLIKAGKAQLYRVLRPHGVQVVRMNGKAFGEENVTGVVRYFLVYAMLFVVAVVLLSLDGFDFLTNFTSVLTCISNDGPGLGQIVGPYGSFAGFSPFGKILLSVMMLAGRLELFPLLLLFLPSTWKKNY